MELGLDFDDGDFTEKVREKQTLISYNAKICSPEWFLSETAEVDENDRATLFKFRGDYFYYRKDMHRAIDCYKTCLDNLGASNRTMRREMMESLARCCISTGDFQSAQTYIDQLVEDSVTIENYCHSLMLQQQMYQNSGNLKDEVRVLHQLISVHPVNSQFWLQLTTAYEKIMDLISLSSAERHQRTCNNLYSVVSKKRQEHLPCCCKHHSTEDNCNEKVINAGDVKNESCPRTCINLWNNEVKDDLSCLTQNLDKASLQSEAVDSLDLHDTRGHEKKKPGSFDDLHDTRGLENQKPGSFDDLHDTRGNKKQEPDSFDTYHICSYERTPAGDPREDFQEILTGYPISLVLLTCYTRTKLIFCSVQGTVDSFIKVKNVQSVQEMDAGITSLAIDEQLLEDATQFVRRDLFEEDTEQNAELEQNGDIKVYVTKKVNSEEFNNRWFSWIKENR